MNVDREKQQGLQREDKNQQLKSSSQATPMKQGQSQLQGQAQSMTSDLRELPVDAATPSARGEKECSCVGPCNCATEDAIRASDEHAPKIDR
ncbi:hypothetical protein BGX29_011643, partial [Mortierella sp. GBA35]